MVAAVEEDTTGTSDINRLICNFSVFKGGDAVDAFLPFFYDGLLFAFRVFMAKVTDYRLRLGNTHYLPVIIGGMGVDISTSELVLEAVKLGGVAHLSDAIVPGVCDKNFGTNFIRNKVEQYYQLQNDANQELRVPLFDVHEYRTAQLQYVGNTVEKKSGTGGVFVNCMEKLHIGSPMEMLSVRLNAILDAGADGISLSAGLHQHSLQLIADHPRFRDVKIGIVVSSWRALKIFLRVAARLDRLPDYIVVEGPLAGGHLGFGADWAEHDLMSIMTEIRQNLEIANLDIPLIAAGGIFDSQDVLKFLENGASAVQVATRFTITQESGLATEAKQAFINATEEDVFVSGVSPTGYPFRLIKCSPCLDSNISPQCVSLGFAIDAAGHCQYIDAYNATGTSPSGEKLPIREKICLCYHILRYHCYTCGTNVVRLKETVVRNEDGSYQLPTTKDVMLQYLNQ